MEGYQLGTFGLNSVVLCLSAIPKFRRYFLDQANTFETGLAAVFKNFIEDRETLRTENLDKIKLALVANKQHQDSSQKIISEDTLIETLTTILDVLHQELNTAPRKDSQGITATHILDLTEKKWTLHTEHNKSLIVDLFHGLQVIKMRCNLRQKDDYIAELISSITITLASSDTSDSLNGLLTKHFQEKRVDLCYEHSLGSNCLPFSLQSFWHLPNILVIGLKRFDGTEAKNECEIVLTETLDMHNFIHVDARYYERWTGHAFKLISVICRNSSDYYCYTLLKNSTDQEQGVWCKFEKADVQTVSKEQVLSERRTAVLLFYQKEEPKLTIRPGPKISNNTPTPKSQRLSKLAMNTTV